MIQVIDEKSQHLQEIIASWHYLGKHTYRKHVIAQQFVQEGNKFHGIYGEIMINAPLETVLEAFIGFGQVDEKSPLQVQKSTICQKFYFCSEEDKRRHDMVVNKQGPYESFYFVTHNVTRSPVALIVSHRDAVVFSVMRFVTQKKAYLYSIEYGYPKQMEGVVRVLFDTQLVELEEIEPNKVKINQYVLCNPKGMIPAWVMNAALDERNNVLLLLKGFCEGEIKPEYGIYK
uniref:START domain-containing protein n=1 Tax=Trepomonas sp. PC1 TaxID=1076344 RepID=A0A146K3E8_9EUKA|eukprot:JAP91217.1 Hypothetical protein TPC1_17235 [Trepomonas sp. PC1]